MKNIAVVHWKMQTHKKTVNKTLSKSTFDLRRKPLESLVTKDKQEFLALNELEEKYTTNWLGLDSPVGKLLIPDSDIMSNNLGASFLLTYTTTDYCTQTTTFLWNLIFCWNVMESLKRHKECFLSTINITWWWTVQISMFWINIRGFTWQFRKKSRRNCCQPSFSLFLLTLACQKSTGAKNTRITQKQQQWKPRNSKMASIWNTARVE